MLQLPGGWGKPVLKVTLKPIAVNAVVWAHRRVRIEVRKGNLGESWGILGNLGGPCMVDHLHDGPHAWNMHGGPLLVAEAIRQLNFQGKCSSWTLCIKISPAAHVKRLCNVHMA